MRHNAAQCVSNVPEYASRYSTYERVLRTAKHARFNGVADNFSAVSEKFLLFWIGLDILVMCT